jgi:hypothetical protein
MRTRSKVILAAAIAAALAGTSGAALAADRPQVTRPGTPQVAQRAASQVTSQTVGPIGGVRLGSSAVREPGSLTVTVSASGCITDVRAFAYTIERQSSPASSLVNTHKGTVFTLHVRIPKGTVTGTWYLASVNATQCGTKSVDWNTEWDGYDSFTVLPPK